MTILSAAKHQLKGKYHCTADLLFISNLADSLLLNLHRPYSFVRIQSRQTGGQLYSDTSPYGECSLLSVLVGSGCNLMTEWLLPISEVHGSNPIIGKIYAEHVLLLTV